MFDLRETEESNAAEAAASFRARNQNIYRMIFLVCCSGSNVFESQTAGFFPFSPESDFLIVSDSFVGRWYFITLPSVLLVKAPGPIICDTFCVCWVLYEMVKSSNISKINQVFNTLFFK